MPGSLVLSAPRCTIRDMAGKGLTEAWRGAMAAKPSDWALRGIVCGPREIDPAIRSTEEWCVGAGAE